MKFGMSTACFFPKLNCEEAASKIGSMGISNVEIFFSTLSEYETSFIKELKKIADGSGIDIYSVHALSLQFEPQLFSMHKRSREDALCIFEKVLAAGAELGAGVYVMHGPAHVKRACSLNLNYEYIAQSTLPLCEMAKSYGIRLAWENVHWCWYAQPQFPRLLEEHLGSGKLFYTLDIKQAAQSGFEPVEYLEYTANTLANIHVCDYVKENDGSIVPVLPFEGQMDHKGIKNSLADIGYDGAVMLEVYSSNFGSEKELLDVYNCVKDEFDF